MFIFLLRDFGEDKNKRGSFHRFLPAISKKQGPFLSKPWITYTAPETRNVWSWFYILFPDSQTSQIPGFAGVEFLVRIPSSPSPPSPKKTPHSENHPPKPFYSCKIWRNKTEKQHLSQKKKCRKLIPKPKISTYHHHLPVFQFPYFWHKKRSHLHILHIPTRPPGADLQEIICQQRWATEGHLNPGASFQHPPKARWDFVFFNSAVGVFWWDYKLVVAHLVRLMFEFYPFSHTHGVFHGKWVYISNIGCPTFFGGGDFLISRSKNSGFVFDGITLPKTNC